MKKNFFKRLVARVLSLTMLMSVCSQTVYAYSERDAALIAELQSYADEYPDGAFAFYNSQLEASEGDGSVYIDVVRMGNMDGEASVTFKAIDISAVYGKDYTLSVDEGFFVTRELEQDYDAEPIVELFAETTGEAVIGEEQTTQETADNVVEIGVSAEDGIIGVYEDFNDAEAEETETETEEDVQADEPEVAEEATGLRAAWSDSTGKTSNRKKWQDVSGGNSAEAEELANELNASKGYVEEFAKGVPGTEYTLDFADGEYLKKIEVKLIDDTLSESEEQIMFVLMEESGAEMALPNTAYLNITDNDEDEAVIFSLPDGAVTVFPEDKYAYVNVERISGMEKFASVSIGTGAITAEPDKDYKAGSIEVVFPQGVKTRTVKVPIFNTNRVDDVTFAVAIDTESAYADEATASVAVTIKGKGEASDEAELSLMSADDESLELFASTDEKDIDDVSISSPSTGTSFGSATEVVKLDLRNATKIDLRYKSSGSYPYTYQVTEGSGCDKKTVNKTGYRTGKEAKAYLNGKEVATLASDDNSVTINVDKTQMNNNVPLSVKVRRTEEGNGGTVSYTVTKVTVYYEDIVVTVDNSLYEDVNTYVEKVYEPTGEKKADNGLKYTEGNEILLGDGKVGGQTSYTAQKFSDAVSFYIVNPPKIYKTTQNVAPEAGTTVYHAGWQVYNPSKNMYDDEIIPPDSMSLEELYARYKGRTSFQVRPVIYPYTSMVRFGNSYPESLAYTNNITAGQDVKVTMLDTLDITAVEINNSGHTVERFLINGFYDTDLHGTKGSARAKNANAVRDYDAEAVKKYLDKNSNGSYAVTKKGNDADASKIVLLPNCEAICLDITYSTPVIEVVYNPADSKTYADKGAVFFFDTEEAENSASGNHLEDMVINKVSFGKPYNINATYTDSGDGGVSQYKTIWQDFTGDMNRDGELSEKEQLPLKKYGFGDRIPSTGDVFTYTPKVTNSLIYYHFVLREPATTEGRIYGTVLLKDYPVFGNKAVTYTPINDATVTVDGITVSTQYDENEGGLEGEGGDGFFEVKDLNFVSGNVHRVNVLYGPLSVAANQSVGVAKAYELDAYDGIRVDSATRSKNGKKLSQDDFMYNDDANYTLSFVTKSTNSALIATKAILKFYREDGTLVTAKEYEASDDGITGVFDCTFNPKTLGLPSGGKITVTFVDNAGASYFEHDTGLYLMQSIGALSLLSSFTGHNSPTLQVLGSISSAFNFGWDGNLDDTEGEIGDFGNYSITTTSEKKIMSIGLSFETDNSEEGNKEGNGDGDSGKDEGKKDDGKKTKKEVKTAADKDTSNMSDADKAKAKEEKKAAADSAADGSNSTQSELAVGFSANFSFGLTLTLATSKDRPGQWCFEEFMIVVKAGVGVSMSKSFVTPIGIPVIVGADIGVEGQAIIVVERRLNENEFYITDMQSDDAKSINIIEQGQNMKEDMYVYGDFTVAPYLTLRAGVGVDKFNISLEGSANFTFNYSTKTKEGSGEVKFSCSLIVTIWMFNKEFDLGSTTVSLFSDGATLYESLDTFNVSEREHLNNRGSWNGGGGFSLFAVANMQEDELLQGVNPYTDTKLAALDDGKYIAVFVDDVPSRTNENSLAVYYSIFDGNSWSQPQIIEDDGTSDAAPAIHDLENGKLFIAWSSASREFDAEDGLLDVMNAKDIQGVFVDKATGELGEVMEITKETEDDVYADDGVQVAYDAETEMLMIYYTKSEYYASDNEEGVYGDAVNPYDVIAYRMYDMKSGEFVDMGDSPDGDWYGQVLLDLAPAVIVNETLDENGYWVEQPEITEYAGEVDPIVIESDAISYDGLSLFAYTLDYDADKATTNDRDVFMQIYNFEENSVSHPIMITSNNVEEKSLQFERVGGSITFLSYLSDGEVKMFDVSSNISQESVTKEDVTDDGVFYYYLDKSRESGYIPEMIAVQSEGGGDYSGELEIVDFDIRTGNKYFYIMFTEHRTKLKEGIDPNSEEAALAENNLAETQIYMTRYDIENGVLTNPVSVTEEAGANYANVAFAVKDNDGGFVAMATKSMSTVREFEGDLLTTADTANSSLCAITFTPDANVTAENAKISGIEAGGAALGSFEVYNGGLETIEGLTVEVKGADGNAIDVTQSVPEAIKLKGGERKEVAFSIPVAEDSNEAEFTAVVKDAEGNELDSISLSDSVARTLDVVVFNADITERGIIEYNAVLKNNSTVASGDKKFAVDAGETRIYSVDVASMKPGETKEINGTFAFDYDQIFESVLNENGSVSADTILTASAGGENLTDTVSLRATADQMARMNAITDVSFATDEEVSVKVGEIFSLGTEITAGKYNGQYPDNNEEEIGAQGVTVKYMSDNEAVAKVYEGGYIEGISKGEATITALVMPADNRFDGVNDVSNYPTLPNEAIETYTFNVNVGKRTGKVSSSTGGVSAEKETCAVKIDAGDGKVESVNVNSNSTIGSIATPEKEGYEFEGWYTDKELTNKADSSMKITSDITLYAKWTEKTGETAWANPFEDVDAADWFYDAVKYVNENGLMNGTEDSVFAADGELTRAMLVTILHRADGEQEADDAAEFDDVAEDAYYAKAVAWAKENGIITGVTDTEFAPDNKITREQIATILYRYAIYKGLEVATMEENLHFDDNDEISEYAVSAMNWIVGQEIINGYEDNTVKGQNSATRAEAATMIKRFIERIEVITAEEAEVAEEVA